MIRLSVCYPVTDGATFDWSYYLDSHVPMLVEAWAPVASSVDKGVNGPYVAMLHLDFASMDALGTAFGSESTGAIMADVANYTTIEPVLQTSEIVS
jgi:uncharacterized protein (TIGR02118 family)